ncbi:MAG: hypothetical protein AB3N23_01495 [Paracoccaceae bacterium]
MATLGYLSATSKRCLSEDAPDLAAIAAKMAAQSATIREILSDYDEICRQLADRETGPGLARDLHRIRVELVSELGRATATCARNETETGQLGSQSQNKE